MKDIENAIYCSNYQDFLDRLICSDFFFSVDLDNHAMYVHSYQGREDTQNDVGFHYYGNSCLYYIPISDLTDVTATVSDAVDSLKSYMKAEVAKKLQDIIKNHLGIKN